MSTSEVVSDTTDTSEGSSSRASSVEANGMPTILDRLRAPVPSHLARKRKVHANPPPPVGKKRSTSLLRKSDPHSIQPKQRASEFPGEELVESAGRLFCRACREDIAIKRSVVVNHINSNKHKESKEKLRKKSAREQDIADALRIHDSETHRKGESLAEGQKVYRVKVVMALMKAGIPIGKLDCLPLRNLLEESGYRLTDTRHLLDLVPFVLQQERALIRSEIQGKHVAIIFDGTTRLGEVLAVVIRFVDEWEVKQRLVRLEFLQKSVNGEELARELISILSVALGVESSYLLAVMHDRASVNGAAMRTVSIVYPNAVDIGCMSHTLDLVGDKFKAPLLHQFFTLWISLFSHSPKARAIWKEQTGRAMSSYSTTRWWSRWEVLNQLLQQFGDVVLFLERNEDVGPATRLKLLGILRNPQSVTLLKVELAAVVDIGSYFVKGTYNLEGDGILAVDCYEEILKIRNAIAANYYPNLSAVCRDIFPADVANQQQLRDYGLACVQPGLQYFQGKFGSDTIHPVSTFKLARLFSPKVASELQPSAADIDELSAIPFLSDQVENLKEELPAYLARASAVGSSSVKLSPTETLEWWKSNSDLVPHWSLAAQRIFLIQPSSAASERVFSILNRLSDMQANSLEDYVESMVMLQYNKRD